MVPGEAAVLMSTGCGRARGRAVRLHVWDVGGVLTQGGSGSNAVAMMLARDHAAPGTMREGVRDPGRFKLVVPAGIGQYSVKGALGWLGCGDALLEVPVTDYRYDLAALRRALRAYDGRVMAVVAYAGDSRTQTIDDLSAAHDVVRSEVPGIRLRSAPAAHTRRVLRRQRRAGLPRPQPMGGGPARRWAPRTGGDPPTVARSPGGARRRVDPCGTARRPRLSRRHHGRGRRPLHERRDVGDRTPRGSRILVRRRGDRRIRPPARPVHGSSRQPRRPPSRVPGLGLTPKTRSRTSGPRLSAVGAHGLVRIPPGLLGVRDDSTSPTPPGTPVSRRERAPGPRRMSRRARSRGVPILAGRTGCPAGATRPVRAWSRLGHASDAHLRPES